jgi:hypothetical protein
MNGQKLARVAIGVILGIVVGSFVNMSIINISPSIIPPPIGVDITTEAGLKAAMHLFKPINFLMPFLAHALGTLVAAFITSLIVSDKKLFYSFIPGVLFLIGGITMVFMLPSPLWFSLVDLLLAYVPMVYLGNQLANCFNLKN